MKTIFGTFFTKILAAACSLTIVVLTTHIFGPVGRGEISLLTADIGLILLLSQIVGGASLVYLYPRSKPFLLVLISIFWALLIPVVMVPVMQFLGWIEHDFALHLIFLCMLFGCASTFQMTVLGAEKIQTYNFLHLMLSVTTLGALFVFFFIFHERDTLQYVYSLYVTYGLALALALLFSKNLLPDKSMTQLKEVIKVAFYRGATVQFSNILQFLNYRLSYFFLSDQMAKLGIFSVSLVLAEAVWLIGNSISLVHFSQVSNETNRETSVKQSFLYAKISFWATLACVTFLSLSPSTWYEFVFGKSFGASKVPTLLLSPGILAIGVGMIFSHYFAGIGKFRINNIAAIMGLVVKIPACLLLIPAYHEIGAAWACTLSYCSSFIFLFIKFKEETGFSFADLAVKKSEWNFLMEQSRNGFLKYSPDKR